MRWYVRKNFLAHQIRISVVFILSHIPVPARGKDKNEQLHAGYTSIIDVIIILKLRHHVTFQRIQVFLVAFFIFFEDKMRNLYSGEQEKKPLPV